MWQVATKSGQPIIGTASADRTACIFSIDSGRCLLQYQGHEGSVNSLKFHPTRDLVLTASGDMTAHIWQAAVNWDTPSSRKGHSSEEELEEDTEDVMEEREKVDVLRTPIAEFNAAGGQGHAAVVVSGKGHFVIVVVLFLANNTTKNCNYFVCPVVRRLVAGRRSDNHGQLGSHGHSVGRGDPRATRATHGTRPRVDVRGRASHTATGGDLVLG